MCWGWQGAVAQEGWRLGQQPAAGGTRNEQTTDWDAVKTEG